MNTETKYKCSQLMVDREGLVSNGERCVYLLLSRDYNNEFGKFCWKAAQLRGGGSTVRNLFEDDLDLLVSAGIFAHKSLFI